MSERATLYEESRARTPRCPADRAGNGSGFEDCGPQFAPAGDLLRSSPRPWASGQSERPLDSGAVLHGRTGDYDRPGRGLRPLAAPSPGWGPGAHELLDKAGPCSLAWGSGRGLRRFVEGKRLVREFSGTAYLADHASGLAGRLTGFFTTPPRA